MSKEINYEMLGYGFKALSDACFEAARQEKEGKPVTACGMSDEDLDELCKLIPFMLNPVMSAEEVKAKLNVSDSTLYRMVQRGDIPDGEHQRYGHTKYWKKWDIMEYLKRKLKK